MKINLIKFKKNKSVYEIQFLSKLSYRKQEDRYIDKKFIYHNYLTFDYLKKQSKPLTIIVLFLSIFVYIWILISGISTVMTYLAWPKSIKYTEYWKIFTPSLLHFSLTHILFNLMWWCYLGTKIERQLGTCKLFFIFIASATFTNWKQSLISNSNFGGLSGILFSLISYAWITSKSHPEKGIYISKKIIIFAISLLFVGYFNIFCVNTANMSHTYGLIIGLLIGLLDNKCCNIKYN
ncbi:MAG: rhomboid family intramembrane serine protease [Arsenophonus sp.]